MRCIKRELIRTFEGLLDVDGILCAGLEVGNATLGLAEGHGALVGDLCQTSVSAAHIRPSQRTHHPLALLNIDLVTNHNLCLLVMLYANIVRTTYEWEALGVHRASLDQELIPPAVESVETLRIVNVVNEHAAISAAVKGDAQRLEAFLSGGVPELHLVNLRIACQEMRDPPA